MGDYCCIVIFLLLNLQKSHHFRKGQSTLEAGLRYPTDLTP